MAEQDEYIDSTTDKQLIVDVKQLEKCAKGYKDFYRVLYDEGDFHLPPMTKVNGRYIKAIFDGEK